MSVTVSDLLKLPSLRQAKVLGGAGGLQKVVSSISVLESTDPSVLVNEVFPHDKYSGSEIVITGFLNCINDVDRQCLNLMRLIDGGEVGLVLYYVGVTFPPWISGSSTLPTRMTSCSSVCRRGSGICATATSSPT